MRIKLVKFTRRFLSNSLHWLNDEEIRLMTNTIPFTEEDQNLWFNNLNHKADYLIWGVETDNIPIGACGLKNITEKACEYWGYIGEKKFWGQGLGSEMISLAEAKARDIGLKNIYLKVVNENSRALSLYIKQGYVYEYQDGKIILMSKIL